MEQNTDGHYIGGFLYRAWIKWLVKSIITIIVPLCCVIGIVHRRCIGSNQWEEFFECYKDETRMLLDQVIIAKLY